MITKVFLLVPSLFGIYWFGFTGLFGSACLFVNTSREKGGKKRCDDLYLASCAIYYISVIIYILYLMSQIFLSDLIITFSIIIDIIYIIQMVNITLNKCYVGVVGSNRSSAPALCIPTCRDNCSASLAPPTTLTVTDLLDPTKVYQSM
jgi:hypothetical protein